MTDLTAVIHELASLFDSMALPYAIMGGIAVRAHGIPRPTFDVDFTLAVPRDRLATLFTAIEGLGYTIPEQHSSGWIDAVGGMPLVKIRLYLEGRGVDADVFLAETDFQQEVLERRIQTDVEGRRLDVITPEDLILFKLVASRPRDLIDVQDVLFMQGQLDEAYLRRWAKPLGVAEKLEEALGSDR